MQSPAWQRGSGPGLPNPPSKRPSWDSLAGVPPLEREGGFCPVLSAASGPVTVWTPAWAAWFLGPWGQGRGLWERGGVWRWLCPASPLPVSCLEPLGGSRARLPSEAEVFVVYLPLGLELEEGPLQGPELFLCEHPRQDHARASGQTSKQAPHHGWREPPQLARAPRPHYHSGACARASSSCQNPADGEGQLGVG